MKALLQKAKNILAAIGGVVLIVLAVLSVLCLGRRSRHFEELEARQADRAKRAKAEEQLAGQTDEAAADREQRFEDAEALRHKIQTGGLIILLAAATFAAGTARAAEPASQGPFVPADYASLKQYYLATWDLAERYRGLLLEAESSVRELRESNGRLLAIVEEQRQEIGDLRAELARARGAGFGLVGGGLWTPAGPGAFIGGTLQF